MEHILEEFYELVQIPSPSLGEREMADALKQKLGELGFFVTEDDAGKKTGGNAGNLFARLPASDGAAAAPILLSAHMDRVPGGDEIIPLLDGDLMVTDGSTILAADDVAGICAILDGVRAVLAEDLPHPEIEILFTISEEVKLKGSRNFDFSKVHAKEAYCMDSSGRTGRIVTGAPKIEELVFRIHGKKAHAGNEPEKGLNALKGAANVLCDIREGRLDNETTANWSVITAGQVTNVVCDLAEVHGEVRSHCDEKVKSYEEYVKKHLAEKLKDTGLTFDFEVRPNHGSFRVFEDSRCLFRLKEAFEKCGFRSEAEIGGGGMDANLINENGIECVGVAVGYMKNHTTEEMQYVKDLIKAGQLVKELVSC